jgi:hypothetical protein
LQQLQTAPLENDYKFFGLQGRVPYYCALPCPRSSSRNMTGSSGLPNK